MIIMIIKDMYCANEPMNMIKWALHTNLMAYKQKHVKSKKNQYLIKLSKIFAWM